MILEIPRSIYNQMVEHAKELNPVECCGYLGGNNETVSKHYKMTNTDNSPEHFSFDPKEQFAAVKDARKEGLKLIGVYHSHPETPARLSEEDIRLFNDPEPVYLIVSLKEETPIINGYKVEKPSNDEISITRVKLTIKEGV